MNTTNQDPWIDEDAPENQTDVVNTPPVSYPVKKPDVAADPRIPSLVLPKPEIPVAQSEDDLKSVLAEIDAELPSNYMECFKVIDALKAKLPARTRLEQKMKAARIKRVSQHIFNLQQVPTCEATPQEYLRAQGARLTQGARIRGESADKHKAAITANAWTSMPVTPAAHVDPIIQAALDDDGIKAKIASIRPTLARYNLLFLENWNICNPRQRLKEIQYAITSHLDYEAAREFTDESVRLSHPHARSIAQSAAAMLITYYDSNCKPGLVALLASVIAHIETTQEHAKELEKEFFESLGEKPEETRVSRKYDAILKNLREHFDRIANPSAVFHIAPTAPHPDITQLTTLFGLQIVE